ncbi:MAG TPA: SRPBCC domain-containing protein, partial [Solirubrobacteraceae bacterium]|nr:SRPBCC domain-containing protein [Solirubrobacteraceae bacterium]
MPVPPADVWAVVGDPHHLPRWWPRTERVEAVDPDAWTSVMRSDRGNIVRADYRVEADEPPDRRAWSQSLAGTPFERLLREHVTEVSLAPAGEGTEVTLSVTQRG